MSLVKIKRIYQIIVPAISPAVLLMVTTATPLEVVVNEPLASGSVRNGTSSSVLPTYEVGVGVRAVLITRWLG